MQVKISLVCCHIKLVIVLHMGSYTVLSFKSQCLCSLCLCHLSHSAHVGGVYCNIRGINKTSIICVELMQ